jgi:hypothetical protein
MNLAHPPSYVLAEYLRAYALAVPHGVTVSGYGYFHSSMPASKDAPVCFTCGDTAGTKDGRIQRTGETILHPGLQVRVRAADYATAWKMITWAMAAVDAAKRSTVGIGTTNYILHAFTTSGSPRKLPPEPETNLEWFTISGTATIKQV